MDAVELGIHRDNTVAFINVKPTVISLLPIDTRERTPSGGWVDTPGEVRSPQTFRIIELNTQRQPPVLRTQDGKVREVNFWLLGAYDAAMAVGDTWTEGDREWEVGDIVRDNGYEVRGLVVEHGK